MRGALNHLLFRIGARAYDNLTGQPLWKGNVLRLLDHVERRRDPLRVLDLGCGPGVSTFALAEALHPESRVVGLDISPEMMARARAHHRLRYRHLENLRFVQADATRLPFEDDTFDLITGHSFLYLVPRRVAALREARRVLDDRGTLVFMEPSQQGSLLPAALQATSHLGAAWRHPAASVRFATSMVLWRLASAVAGRMHPDLVTDLFRQAGFARVRCHPTLAGLGLHVVGSGRQQGSDATGGGGL